MTDDTKKDDPVQLGFSGAVVDLYIEGGDDRKSQLPAIKKLIDQGMDINYQKRGHLSSPLYWVVYHGDHETLSYMMDHGADIHMAADRNKTLLMSALLFSHWECADLLMKAGVDLEVKDSRGWDVFDEAKNRNEPSKSKTLDVLNAEVKRRADAKLAAKKKRYDDFKEAAQNVDKLSAPIRVRRHSGFKNQRGSK